MVITHLYCASERIRTLALVSHEVKLDGGTEGREGLGAVGNDWPSRWVAPINAVRRGMTGKNLLFLGPISLLL